jgi:2,5-diketo-D-gluconate reductase A
MGYPVLPKSTKLERMQQNADLFSFALSEEEMAAIAKLDRGDGVAWSVGDPTKGL